MAVSFTSLNSANNLSILTGAIEHIDFAEEWAEVFNKARKGPPPPAFGQNKKKQHFFLGKPSLEHSIANFLIYS